MIYLGNVKKSDKKRSKPSMSSLKNTRSGKQGKRPRNLGGGSFVNYDGAAEKSVTEYAKI